MHYFKSNLKPGIDYYQWITGFLNSSTVKDRIVFQVYQESPIKGRIPIDNAMVTVNKYLGNGYFVSKVLYTDSDGKTVPLPFFTPDKKFSMTPGNDHVYETYSAYIGAPDFKTAYVSDIQVFDGITSIQSVILLPE